MQMCFPRVFQGGAIQGKYTIHKTLQNHVNADNADYIEGMRRPRVSRLRWILKQCYVIACLLSEGVTGNGRTGELHNSKFVLNSNVNRHF